MDLWPRIFAAMVWFIRVGVPVLMIVVGLAAAVQRIAALRRRRWVMGTVIDFIESQDADGRGYRAKIAYQAAGREWEVLDEMSFGWKVRPLGGRLWVGYVEEAPGQAIVWRTWPVAMALAIAAAGAAGAAASMPR